MLKNNLSHQPHFEKQKIELSYCTSKKQNIKMSTENHPLTDTRNFIWHDYETTGINKALDRPVQFAAVKTDNYLTPTGEEWNFYCKLTRDVIPKASAMTLTRINPFDLETKGLEEYEFAKKIYEIMIGPDTCSLGYNTIKFDDEVTRNLFYRNFFEIYDRENKNGNSRWDLIDLTRAFYAISPECLNWPKKEDGTPDFKLENLAKENNLIQEQAHNALSDVKATLNLAQTLRTHDKDLFDYIYSMRGKENIARLMDENLNHSNLLGLVSGFVKSTQGCLTFIQPFLKVKNFGDQYWCVDFTSSEDVFNELIENPRKGLLNKFKKADGRDSLNSAICQVRTNKSSIIIHPSKLKKVNWNRLGISGEEIKKRYSKIKPFLTNSKWLEEIKEAIFELPKTEPYNDVEQKIYQGAFLSYEDKKRCALVRGRKEPSDKMWPNFSDERMKELLFRYKNRHSDETTAKDKSEWSKQINNKIVGKFDESTQSYSHGSIGEFLTDWKETFLKKETLDEKQEKILYDTMEYAKKISAYWGADMELTKEYDAVMKDLETKRQKTTKP